MAPRGEACAECTQNCHLMHKKNKNPSPVCTTFFKVMFGDEYSKVLFLPPRFAHSAQKNIGKSTWLEDSNGEKWKVKFTNVDGLLAFEEGWNKFWLDHGLKVGDFLVFHYIMESHFVVSMYGESGCPEIRHFGFTGHQKKKTRKERQLTKVDHTPPNIDTNGHHPEIESQQNERRIKKKRTDDNMIDTMPPNFSPKKIDNHMVASTSRSQPSDSDKEKSQRSKSLVNTNPNDNMICETPANYDNNVHVEEVEDADLGGYKSNKIRDLSITEKSSGGRKDDVAAVGGGGGDETRIKESGKVLEIPSKKVTEKPKEIAYTNTIKKRLRNTTYPTSPTKKVKRDPFLTSQTDVSGSKLRNVDGAPASPVISPKPVVTPTKIIKKEQRDTSGSKPHHDGVPSTSTRTPQKPIAKPMEPPKKNPTINRGSIGATKTPHVTKTIKEENGAISPKVKPEPVDYDESPSTVATNTVFSAVMTSYKYLELPKELELKSKVIILLRNKGDLWPVLCQYKVGLNALTQGWEVFARQRGIQLGDNCQFVLESEANSNFTCSVFQVRITRK